jgi:hypothetical protein
LAEWRIVVLIPRQSVILRVSGLQTKRYVVSMAAPCEACTASDEEEHLGASESELQDARVEAEIEVVFAHLAQLVGVLVGLADEVRRDRAVELITIGSLSLASQVPGATMMTREGTHLE